MRQRVDKNGKPVRQRRSIRLKNFDYSRSGFYFITLCCENRRRIFGSVSFGEMYLSKAGAVAEQCWKDIPRHFPNVKLHAFVIMPDHVHGLIEIVKEEEPPENLIPVIAAIEELVVPRNKYQNMIPRSVGSIVKGFKIGVSKWMHQNTNVKKVWQRNYYESVVRNRQAFRAISRYIENNPKRWTLDGKG